MTFFENANKSSKFGVFIENRPTCACWTQLIDQSAKFYPEKAAKFYPEKQQNFTQKKQRIP
jgi:hypothetical protein